MKMDFKIQGLKCDNPDCDFCDLSIPFEQYEQYVNYPCPKCGQPLLTPQAYKMCLALKSMGNFITKLTGGAKEVDTIISGSLDMDKDGHIKLK